MQAEIDVVRLPRQEIQGQVIDECEASEATPMSP